MGSLSKKKRNLGFAWQLTLAIMIILLIPILAVVIIYYNIFQDSILREANKKMQMELNKEISNMESSLVTVDSVFSLLSYEHEFPYFLDARNQLSEKEVDYYSFRVQEILQSIRHTYSNQTDNIAIYAKNNQIIRNADWSFYYDDLKKFDYYDEIQMMEKEILFGHVRKPEYVYPNLASNVKVESINTLILPIYKKIYSYGQPNEEVGLLELNIAVNKLIDNQSFVAEPDIKYLLFDKSLSLAYAVNTEAGESFHGVSFPDQSGSFETRIDGVDYLLMYHKCSRTGLIRAVAMDKAVVILPAKDMIIRLIVISLLGGLIVMLCTNMIVKKMLKRLLDMDKKMARIEKGDFSVRVNEKGTDEIARIASSFNHMAVKLQKLLINAVEEEKAKKEAELKALQAQINPHFLYNSLENMRMQCEMDGYYVVGESLAELGELFRYSVKWDSYEVPFSLEWNNLKNYISIMKMRFGDNLKCNLECSDEVVDITVPKFILQPLVENCFNHGFKNVITSWMLSVKAEKIEDELIIIIEDNGRGIGEERLERIRYCLRENQRIYDESNTRSSIGIINVNQRIEMICKKGSGLFFDSKLGRGTTITVTIK